MLRRDRVGVCVLVVTLAAICSGCNKALTKRSMVQADIDYILKTDLNLGSTRQPSKEFRDMVDGYYGAAVGDESRRLELRNRIIEHMLVHVRAYHEAHYDDLYEYVSGAETASDVAVLGLGTIGAITSQGTSQILSAVSAGVVGIRASAQVNFLNDMNKFAVLVRMETIRSEMQSLIYAGMAKTTAEYPLHAAAGHVQQFLDNGSIREAATLDAEEAVADFETARKNLRKKQRELLGLPPDEEEEEQPEQEEQGAAEDDQARNSPGGTGGSGTPERNGQVSTDRPATQPSSWFTGSR